MHSPQLKARLTEIMHLKNLIKIFIFTSRSRKKKINFACEIFLLSNISFSNFPQTLCEAQTR